MVDNSKLTAIWSSKDTNIYDVMFYADDNSYTLANGAFGYTINYPATTQPVAQGLPIGIFTLDGTNWYQLDYSNNYLLLSLPGGGLQLRYAGTGSGTVTPHFKVGVLSIAQTEKLTKPLGGGNVLSYTSQGRYQPIAFQGEIAMAAGSGSVTITHNLGYVPTVKLWNRSTDNIIAPLFTSATGYAGQGLRIDANNLYLDGTLGANFAFQPKNWIYRIYADA